MALAWKQLVDLTGDQGPAGADGLSFRRTSSAITAGGTVAITSLTGGKGNVGDLILDKNNNMFQVTAKGRDNVTVGDLLANLKGSDGAPGKDGDKGGKGDPFTVAKTYESVDAMNAAIGGDNDVPEGSFVVIDTGNVDDEDNAKLYLRGKDAFSYITDLSGAAGIKGDPGEPGAAGAAGIGWEYGDAVPTDVTKPKGTLFFNTANKTVYALDDAA